MAFFIVIWFLSLGSSCFSLPFLSTDNLTDISSQRLSSSDLALDIQQLADLAMNHLYLNNQSLLQLYQESMDIINGTEADSVLLELNPISDDDDADDEPIMVMAVYNPSVPSHQDLLNRFRLYFVNLTENLPSSKQTDYQALSRVLNDSTQNVWTIFKNFISNQANAVTGAFWIPFNVGAKAMLQSSSEHAQAVLAGSTFGSVISKPIIMNAIDLPSNIAERVISVMSSKIKAIEMAELQSKQTSSQAVHAIANGLTNGAQFSSQITKQYVVKPVGAFTGFNLNLAGNTLAGIGQQINSMGVQLTLLGQRLGFGAMKAVDAGATAIAWGLDNSVHLPGEQSSTQLDNTSVQR